MMFQENALSEWMRLFDLLTMDQRKMLARCGHIYVRQRAGLDTEADKEYLAYVQKLISDFGKDGTDGPRQKH